MQTSIKQWLNFTLSSGNHAVIIVADEPTRRDIEELASEFLASQNGLSLLGEYCLGMLLSEKGQLLTRVSCSFDERYVLLTPKEEKDKGHFAKDDLMLLLDDGRHFKLANVCRSGILRYERSSASL